MKVIVTTYKKYDKSKLCSRSQEQDLQRCNDIKNFIKNTLEEDADNIALKLTMFFRTNSEHLAAVITQGDKELLDQCFPDKYGDKTTIPNAVTAADLLKNAIRSGNKDAIQKFSSVCATKNFHLKGDVLKTAILEGDNYAFNILISYGFFSKKSDDFDIKDLLDNAIEAHNNYALDKIIAFGIDDEIRYFSEKVSHHAVKNCNDYALDKLIEAGVDLNGSWHSSIPYIAVKNCNDYALDKLIEAGVDLNGSWHSSIPYIAVKNCNDYALDKLIEAGVDLNSFVKAAAQSNNVYAAKKCAALQLDAEAENNKGLKQIDANPEISSDLVGAEKGDIDLLAEAYGKQEVPLTEKNHNVFPNDDTDHHGGGNDPDTAYH